MIIIQKPFSSRHLNCLLTIPNILLALDADSKHCLETMRSDVATWGAGFDIMLVEPEGSRDEERRRS